MAEEIVKPENLTGVIGVFARYKGAPYLRLHGARYVEGEKVQQILDLIAKDRHANDTEKMQLIREL